MDMRIVVNNIDNQNFTNVLRSDSMSPIDMKMKTMKTIIIDAHKQNDTISLVSVNQIELGFINEDDVFSPVVFQTNILKQEMINTGFTAMKYLEKSNSNEIFSKKEIQEDLNT